MTSDSEKTNLIINYLPQTLTDAEFSKLFLTIGAIRSSNIVRERVTGYSYGFGFVNYYSEEDAQLAIGKLDGHTLKGKKIKVALARKGDKIKGANLYVRGLPTSYTKEDVSELFSSCGDIIQVTLLGDKVRGNLVKETGDSRGVAFVLFDNRDQADKAIKELNGKTQPDAKGPLHVVIADNNSERLHRPHPPIARYGYGGRGRRPGPPPMWAQHYGFHGGRGPMYHSPGYPYRPSMPHPKGEEEGHILFVYNIGAHTNERGLYLLFSPFGPIQKVNIILDHRKLGTGRGFGFVKMRNHEDACNAIESLDGFDFQGTGHPLQVSFKSDKGSEEDAEVDSKITNDKPNETATDTETKLHPLTETDAPKNSTSQILFVYNIGPYTNERELWYLFSPYGIVQKVDIIVDFGRGIGKGFGFITMKSLSDAEEAISELNGFDFLENGRPLQVSFKSDSKDTKDSKKV